MADISGGRRTRAERCGPGSWRSVAAPRTASIRTMSTPMSSVCKRGSIFSKARCAKPSNVALLDAVLKQAADIRRQALASAEQAWLDIVEAAQIEAARQQAEAIREAGRLLDDACAEIRSIHERLQPPTPTTPLATHRHLDGSDTGAPQSKRQGRNRRIHRGRWAVDGAAGSYA